MASISLHLIGVSGSGKSLLFDALTETAEGASFVRRGDVRIGSARMSDPRLEYLRNVFRPKKFVPAEIQFADPEPRQKPHPGEPSMAEADAFVMVVQAFDERRGAEPAAQLESLLLDLVLADLERIERRHQRAEKEKRAGRSLPPLESRWLNRCRERLESGRPLLGMDFTPEEEIMARPYAFLSRKPLMAAANVAEENLEGRYLELLMKRCREIGVVCLPVCAALESEISRLEPDAQADFLSDYGLHAPAKDRLIQESFHMLDLISFFTVGEDEVKAWTLRQGANAQTAAGKIHSDIERGFIRAEVVAFDAFQKAGSLAACKGNGGFRLEGKEYIVRDGEIVHFRFHV